jgi:hypothetical protein
MKSTLACFLLFLCLRVESPEERISRDSWFILRSMLALTTANYRDHWVPQGAVERCQNKSCDRQFTFYWRKRNCHCCGKVYCSSCCYTRGPVNLGPDLQHLSIPICARCVELNGSQLFEHGAPQNIPAAPARASQSKIAEEVATAPVETTSSVQHQQTAGLLSSGVEQSMSGRLQQLALRFAPTSWLLDAVVIHPTHKNQLAIPSDDRGTGATSEEPVCTVCCDPLFFPELEAVSDGEFVEVQTGSSPDHISAEQFQEALSRGPVIQLAKCKHCFHESCIRQWAVQNPCCPVCRTRAKVGLLSS